MTVPNQVLLVAFLFLFLCVNDCTCYTKRGQKRNKRRNYAGPYYANENEASLLLSETLHKQVLTSKRGLKRKAPRVNAAGWQSNAAGAAPGEAAADRNERLRGEQKKGGPGGGRKNKNDRKNRGQAMMTTTDGNPSSVVNNNENIIQVMAPQQGEEKEEPISAGEDEEEQEQAHDQYFDGQIYWNFPKPEDLQIQVVKEQSATTTNYVPPSNPPTKKPTFEPTTSAPIIPLPTPIPTNKPTETPTEPVQGTINNVLSVPGRPVVPAQNPIMPGQHTIQVNPVPVPDRDPNDVYSVPVPMPVPPDQQQQQQHITNYATISPMPTPIPTNHPTPLPTNKPTGAVPTIPVPVQGANNNNIQSVPVPVPVQNPKKDLPAATNQQQQQQVESHQVQQKQIKPQEKQLEGPGCSFRNPDSTVTDFDEGQSMGLFSMVHSCANNVPAAFPGYCISSAPNQTVYPYCFFKDAFNQNICGRSGDEIGLLHPNRTLIHCQCFVSVTPYGRTYDIKVTSNCDMIDLTTTAPAPAMLSDMFDESTTTTPTPMPVTPLPTKAPTLAPLTPSPVTAKPTMPPSTPPSTSTPTEQPTKAPITSTLSPVATTTPAPVTSNLSPVTTHPTFNSESHFNDQHILPEDHFNAVTYQPGNLTAFKDGLWLSKGLSARILARAGHEVPYSNSMHGTESVEAFHPWPDGAAIFNDNRPGNSGGYIYVSNSEMKNGGVGAVTFNKFGDVIHYRQILFGTTYNCNGGRTPWGSWVTAEEDFDNYEGKLWQVDPYGVRQPQPLTLGQEGGAWEAFAYDIRNLTQPRFFASEDDEKGCLRRWTPQEPKWGMDPWPMLHGPGVTEYLMLQPPDFSTGGTTGRFYWTTNEKSARDNAKDYYPYSEGIEVQGQYLYFVVKNDYRLFTLNLDEMTYTSVSTRAGLFDGEPDQIKTILQEDGTTRLYFSEDWGQVAGIHARDQDGNIATILEGPQYSPETTGIAFSPDGKRMYFTFQENGVLFEVTRDDGLSFHGRTVNLKPRHTTDPATYRRRK